MSNKERIMQKSVGLRLRHHDFFNWCTEHGVLNMGDMRIKFKPDSYIRHAIDEQIKLMSKVYPEVKQFLKDE